MLIEGRDVRKLMEKTAWFHDKPQSSQKSSFMGPRVNYKRRNQLTAEQRVYQPHSVLFILRTNGGALLK